MQGIGENEARRLRTVCGLKDFDAGGNAIPVPHEVAQAWLEFKRCYCRISGTVEADIAMAIIAQQHGYGAAVDGEGWNAADEWFAKRLKYGDYVGVRWRGATRLAKAIRFKTNRKTATIQFDGDAGERDVQVALIVPSDPALMPAAVTSEHA